MNDNMIFFQKFKRHHKKIVQTDSHEKNVEFLNYEKNVKKNIGGGLWFFNATFNNI
jgi:hypothetical protein